MVSSIGGPANSDEAGASSTAASGGAGLAETEAAGKPIAKGQPGTGACFAPTGVQATMSHIPGLPAKYRLSLMGLAAWAPTSAGLSALHLALPDSSASRAEDRI